MSEAEDRASAERIRLRFEKMRAEREAYWASRSSEDLLRMRIEESRGDADPITKALLGAAVPMWIDRMRHWRPEYREQKARELGNLIAHEQGIAAMCDPDARGTAKKGELARCFNAVGQGLALLAFCPGGIVFAGHHFEAGAAPVPAEASP